jgi:hypothetical protein
MAFDAGHRAIIAAEKKRAACAALKVLHPMNLWPLASQASDGNGSTQPDVI